MKTLYLDCGMGAAGDMLTAALIELLPDPDAFVAKLNTIGVPDVVYERKIVQPYGVTGTHMSVRVDGMDEYDFMQGHHAHDHHDHDHEHEHHDHDHEHGHYEHDREHHHTHRSLASVETIIEGLAVSGKVKADALAVYRRIAEAEAHVHGCTVEDIHFHEVGKLDAIADVAAVCMLIERLAPEKIIASPVHVGSGSVRCAHGILPVPAPATAYLLEGVPIYGGEIQGELCTPTGAALLQHFVTSFGAMPPLKTEAIGYGMGTKDFGRLSCVRALYGETVGETDTMCELSANVDDMTAEDVGFATEKLFEAGAVEVYTVPVGMKKNRPGTLLRAICTPEKRETVAAAFFRHTTTLGVREVETRRYVLSRTIETKQTSFGPVRVKRSTGYGVVREKPEYDDLARIAKENGLSLAEARAAVLRER